MPGPLNSGRRLATVCAKLSGGPAMLRQVTCIVVLGASLSAAAARAQDAAAPALPALPAEVQDLKGKRVAIYYDLDLLGTGKPSPLHTQYVSLILQRAGATVLRGGGGQTTFDVVIFGESAGLAQYTPAERADP